MNSKTYSTSHPILPLLMLGLLALASATGAAADDRQDRQDRQDRDRDRDGQRGVTLYDDEDFRGESEFFAVDDSNLENNRIGSDRASSVRVDRGCRATLYRNHRYKGDSVVLDRDESSLTDTRVGNDSVTSLLVRCAGRGGNTDGDYGWGEGATLFSDSDFRGRSQSFDRHVRDLRGSQIGNDDASSVRVARGCEVVLYAGANFRGESTTTEKDIENLSETRVGNDQVSSLEVRCRRR